MYVTMRSVLIQTNQRLVVWLHVNNKSSVVGCNAQLLTPHNQKSVEKNFNFFFYFMNSK